MGHKVNPIGFRTGVVYPTKSTWFAGKKTYAKNLLEDVKIRKFLEDKLSRAGLTHTEIKRSINSLDVYIHISRPGVVIGRGGSGLELIKSDLQKLLHSGKSLRISIHPQEIKNPEISAVLVGERIRNQLEHRYPHRRAANQAIEKVMASGGLGIKILFSGRIDGAEIGRIESYKQGRIPTQTLRSDIDYYEKPAHTRSGYIGIKVWVYKGELTT